MRHLRSWGLSSQSQAQAGKNNVYKMHAVRNSILTRVMGGIADNWKELRGENNWEGLLDPLDINLRQYIIHYGERVQAVYDSSNGEEVSKMYGFPRYLPEVLFSNVGLEKGNPYKYSVTNYFYAMSKVPFIDCFILDQSAWIGYVAVATDEGKQMLGRRDILISWRGTQGATEWLKDFQFLLVPTSDIFRHTLLPPMVEHGFLSIYTTSDSSTTYSKSSARDQVLSVVRTLVDKYKDEEISITVTGHSLGSALATLNAANIVANGYNKPTGSDTGCMVTAFVFASPKVGDFLFKAVFAKLNNLHLLRIRNANDIVPLLPPLGYFDVGKELKIDTNKSPYAKSLVPPSSLTSVWHNLENYLHGVVGTQGDDEINLVVDPVIALVNKGLDILKTEFWMPANWWTIETKGLVQLDRLLEAGGICSRSS